MPAPSRACWRATSNKSYPVPPSKRVSRRDTLLLNFAYCSQGVCPDRLAIFRLALYGVNKMDFISTFQGISRQLIIQFNVITSELSHPGLMGSNREHATRQFLSQHLTLRFPLTNEPMPCLYWVLVGTLPLPESVFFLSFRHLASRLYIWYYTIRGDHSDPIRKTPDKNQEQPKVSTVRGTGQNTHQVWLYKTTAWWRFEPLHIHQREL